MKRINFLIEDGIRLCFFDNCPIHRNNLPKLIKTNYEAVIIQIHSRIRKPINDALNENYNLKWVQ